MDPFAILVLCISNVIKTVSLSADFVNINCLTYLNSVSEKVSISLCSSTASRFCRSASLRTLNSSMLINFPIIRTPWEFKILKISLIITDRLRIFLHVVLWCSFHYFALWEYICDLYGCLYKLTAIIPILTSDKQLPINRTKHNCSM